MSVNYLIKFNFMKNNPFKIFLFALLLLSLILPTVVLAVPTDDLLKQPRKVDFCDNLATYSPEILERLAEKETDYAARVAESQTRYQERMAAMAVKIDLWHDWWEGDITPIYFNNFKRNAKTDQQKAAVEKFVSTMRDAIAKRRAAIEAAVTDYQAKVKIIMDARRSKVTNYRAEFIAAVKTALEKAKASCANGVDSKLIREQLRLDLKTARDNFKNKMKVLEKDATELKSLRDNTRQTVIKARSEFQATFRAAKQELEIALKKK